ncbi:hypothetical protein ACFXKG_20850 [Streptomyces sp. NPDC059255]|uniref:hypothetical protein n=1 Tax=Streptomyces sp. NPDC059255 TaxID=3346793 RepID=UPI0036910C6E
MIVPTVIAGALGRQAPEPSSASVSSSFSSSAVTSPSITLRSEHRGVLGEADGVVLDDVTGFDGAIPAVADLGPDPVEALPRAGTAAADDGVGPYQTYGNEPSPREPRTTASDRRCCPRMYTDFTQDPRTQQ